MIKAQVLAGGRGKGYFDNGLKGGVRTIFSWVSFSFFLFFFSFSYPLADPRPRFDVSSAPLRRGCSLRRCLATS